MLSAVLQKGVNDKRFIADHALAALEAFTGHHATLYGLITKETASRNAKVAALAWATTRKCLQGLEEGRLREAEPSLVRAIVQACLKGKLSA